MAVNDFLTVAGGTGANVTSQADYASNAVTNTGFVAGTAQSTLVNKALRQSSIVSSMIAQFTADNSTNDSIDNGTIHPLLENFELALSNLISSGGMSPDAINSLITSYLTAHPIPPASSGIETGTGWIKFGGAATPIMIQWFTMRINDLTPTQHNFPVAFATQCLFVMAGTGIYTSNGANYPSAFQTQVYDKTQFTVHINGSNNQAATVEGNFLAIGF